MSKSPLDSNVRKMGTAHPSNSTQSAGTIPMVSPTEMKSVSENKAKSPELDSPAASKEEHYDIDTTTRLTGDPLLTVGGRLQLNEIPSSMKHFYITIS
ncbi:hypothetical protein ETB97_003354 [Aspergillus alliaceus]|uniref:Uncharacterized protein n=1 Tax=Petromyces alliaceus TaxID=209559 RepID=A0A8H6ABH9_PETAA|nr:hypothetical protein ETB97_003354 [Aspergillus burnettii]